MRSKWLLIALGALAALVLAGILVEVRCAVPGQPSAAVTPDDLPDHTITPGVVDPKVTQANIRSIICTGDYTKSVRPTVAPSGAAATPFAYSLSWTRFLRR